MTSANVRGMKKCFKVLKIMVGVMTVGLMAASGECALAAEGTTRLPELYFKAVNPGYTIDGTSNVGEMIEIARGESSDEMILLAGVTIRYTNTSGNEVILAEFSENGYLAGETLLLRLASSPGSELANLVYKKTLAMNAKLELWRGEEILDTVCWTGKDECLVAFNKNTPTTLVRNVETGEFEHLELYEPNYNEENYVLKDEEKPDEDEKISEGGGGITEVEDGKTDEKLDDGYGEVKSQCKNLQFSEILSYYAETQAEQFVEFYNAGAEQMLLDGCALKYKNKLYPLTGIVKAEGYMVRVAEDFKLTKNPTNSNTLEIVDVDGAVVDKLEYPNGQRKGVAWAMIGYDEKGEELWHTTYAVTPGEPNVYQEYKTCEEGKVINEETGNCVKVTEVVEKTCAVGQYLNPLTGRCKKIEVEEEKVCKEGYYFYEPTGRCRKVVENDGAEYDLGGEEAEGSEKESSFVAVYAVLFVVGLGVVYIIYEYRKEIGRIFKRLLKR